MADNELIYRIVLEAVDQATQDIDNVNAHIKRLKEEFLSNEFTRTAQGAEMLGGKLGELTAPLDRAAKDMLQLNGALVAVASVLAGTAYKASVDYESALSNLAKALDVGRAEAEAHGAALNKLALQYGQNGAALVGGMTEFVQAGFSVSDAFGLVEQGIKLMIAGDLSATEASANLVAILKGFEAPASEAGRAVDILNQVSNKYATDVKQLALGMANVSPIAKQMGFSFEETAGLLTPIIEVFGSGTEAAVALKTGLLRLIDDSKPVREALAEIGVAQRDANGDLRSGRDIYLDVAKAFQGLGANQQLYLTQQLAGIDQAPKLAKAFSDIGKYTEIAGVGLRSAGSASGEVAERLKTAQSEIDRASESYRQLAVSLGGALKPEITGVVASTGKLARAFDDAVKAGDLKPLLSAIRPQIEAVENLFSAMADNLDESLAGLDFTPIINGLESLTGDFGQAFKRLFDGYDPRTAEGLRNLLQAIVNELGNLAQGAGGLLDGLGPLFDGLNELFRIFTRDRAEVSRFVGEIVGLGESIHRIGPFVGEVGGLVFGLVGKIAELTAGIYLGKKAFDLLAAAGVPTGAILSKLAGLAGDLILAFGRLPLSVSGALAALAGFPGLIAGAAVAAGGLGYGVGVAVNKLVEMATGGRNLGGVLADLKERLDGTNEEITRMPTAAELAAAKTARLAREAEAAAKAVDADSEARKRNNAQLIESAEVNARVADIVKNLGLAQESAAEKTKKLDDALGKFGLDAEQALTGISPKIREALGDFDALGKALENSGKTGRETGKIIAAAMTDIVGKAKTTEELQAIQQKFREVSETGKADAAALIGGWSALQKALAEHPPTLEQVRAAQDKANASADALTQALRAGKDTTELRAQASRDAADALALQTAASNNLSEVEKKRLADAAAQLQTERAARAERNQAQADAAAWANSTARKNAVMAEELKKSLEGTAAVAALMGNAWSQINNQVKGFSTEAAAYLQTLLNQVPPTSDGLFRINALMEQGLIFARDAQKQTDRNAEAVRALNDAGKDGEGIQQALRAANEQLNRSLYYTNESWADMYAVANAHGQTTIDTLQNVRLLGDEKLANLRAAIADANNKLKDMTENARQGRQALESELLQLQGNQIALENRDYEAKKAQYQADRQAAVKAGAPKAVAEIDKELALLDQVHEIKLANAKAQEEEAKARAAAAKAADDAAKNKPAPNPAPEPQFQERDPYPLRQPTPSQAGGAPAASGGAYSPAREIGYVTHRFEAPGGPRSVRVFEEDSAAFIDMIQRILQTVGHP
jgi:TP901 family phage tail tape measure protein